MTDDDTAAVFDALGECVSTVSARVAVEDASSLCEDDFVGVRFGVGVGERVSTIAVRDTRCFVGVGGGVTVLLIVTVHEGDNDPADETVTVRERASVSDACVIFVTVPSRIVPVVVPDVDAV